MLYYKANLKKSSQIWLFFFNPRFTLHYTLSLFSNRVNSSVGTSWASPPLGMKSSDCTKRQHNWPRSDSRSTLAMVGQRTHAHTCTKWKITREKELNSWWHVSMIGRYVESYKLISDAWKLPPKNYLIWKLMVIFAARSLLGVSQLLARVTVPYWVCGIRGRVE